MGFCLFDMISSESLSIDLRTIVVKSSEAVGVAAGDNDQSSSKVIETNLLDDT